MSADVFRALHHSARPLVLPNVWDAASARAFERFPALATSSSAVAASLGYADGEQTPRDEMFGALRRITRAVQVPVTADVEAGYGLEPAELVDRLLQAGVVGCNLEDTDPRTESLKDPGAHADWLAAVRAAAGTELVINARVDVFMRHGTSAEAISRGQLYVNAGADCVYPIFAPPEKLSIIAEGVQAPINAIHLPGGPPVARLAELGASRITFGGGLFAQAIAGVESLAQELLASLPSPPASAR